jgi:hypothetical protein
MNRIITALLIISGALLVSCAAPSHSVRNLGALSGVQAELQSLQAPAGADPRVFQQLKDELAFQLAQNGWRTVSAPPDPVKPANDITDLGLGLVVTDWTLTWGYYNLGDYDQNGTVGVSDITPLAMHWGHAVGTDALDEVIDGDGNNSIGITDITPIAQNFTRNVAGYAVMQSSNGVDWTELERVSFASAAETARKELSSVLAAPADLEMYLVRAYDSTEAAFGADSNAVRYAASDLTVVLITSASGGTGVVDDPYIVDDLVGYDIRVYYDRGGANEADVTDFVTFDTFPPAFISFAAVLPGDPQVMTVDNAMAGNFYINAIWGDFAPITSVALYFRVQGGLPG